MDELEMSEGRKYQDRSWLYEQYVENQKSTLEIADECGCDPQTISNWLKKHGIKTRSRSPICDERLTDGNWLWEQYVENQKSTLEIADECGCSRDTVGNWLKKHNIERRTQSAADERLTDREWLHEQYVERGRTMKDIATECGCSKAVVHKYIHRHEIVTRVASPPADGRLTDERWLREQYVDQSRSAAEIAAVCDCSHSVVLEWIKKHGIETREFQEALPTGKDHPRWNGGRYSYGPGWNLSKKQAVRERDGFTCQGSNCDMTQREHMDKHGQKLHVHHLRKARHVDDPEQRNAKENLITLCRDCHREWEKIADAGLVPEITAVNAN